MKKIPSFIDNRSNAFCVYCGEVPSTRDHVPSKVLLDEPFPPDLPVVSGCKDCNEDFSPDEEYVACLLECVITGDVNPEFFGRKKIADSLRNQPGLLKKLASQKRVDAEGNIAWEFDVNRLKNVLFKLASGHAFFELGLPMLGKPERIEFMPLSLMKDSQRAAYESPMLFPDMLPEVDSRALQRIIASPFDPWQVVQADRYRYRVDQSSFIVVRMVLSEYLAGEVVWFSMQ